jgi:hypothetical protein
MMQKRYTAELSKGQGIIEETVALLRVWEPGMDTMALKDQVKRDGIIDRATALRVEDIVGRLFAPRFLVDDGSPAKNLKLLLSKGLPVSKLHQLFFMHAARAHPILHDFVTQVYWPRYAAGITFIARQDALAFVERAKDTGLVTPPWSTSTTTRMARYVGTALADFGLIGADHAGRREILPFRLSTLSGRYLAYERHFRKVDDNTVQHAEDWQLFGLEPMDVRHELERISGNHFIVQHTGDLLRISWTHPSMEEALHAIAADELR